LRQIEVRIDRIDRLQRDDRIARVQILARIDRRNPDPARERVASIESRLTFLSQDREDGAA